MCIISTTLLLAHCTERSLLQLKAVNKCSIFFQHRDACVRFGMSTAPQHIIYFLMQLVHLRAGGIFLLRGSIHIPGPSCGELRGRVIRTFFAKNRPAQQICAHESNFFCWAGRFFASHGRPAQQIWGHHIDFYVFW